MQKSQHLLFSDRNAAQGYNFRLIEGQPACEVWGNMWSSKPCDSHSAPPLRLCFKGKKTNGKCFLHLSLIFLFFKLLYTYPLSFFLFFKLHFYSPETGILLLKLLNCASNIYYSWSIKKMILLEFLFIFYWLLDWEKPRWYTWRLQMLSFLEK